MKILKKMLNQFHDTTEKTRLFTVDSIMYKLNFLQLFIDTLNLYEANISRH